MKCKARLITSGDRVVSSRIPGHKEEKITVMTVAMAPSASQAAVMSELLGNILMALTRQATVSKALPRRICRKKLTDAANGDTPLPAFYVQCIVLHAYDAIICPRLNDTLLSVRTLMCPRLTVLRLTVPRLNVRTPNKITLALLFCTCTCCA